MECVVMLPVEYLACGLVCESVNLKSELDLKL